MSCVEDDKSPVGLAVGLSFVFVVLLIIVVVVVVVVLRRRSSSRFVSFLLSISVFFAFSFFIKAKFHYASWFEDGSKLVADRFEPALNQLA